MFQLKSMVKTCWIGSPDPHPGSVTRIGRRCSWGEALPEPLPPTSRPKKNQQQKEASEGDPKKHLWVCARTGLRDRLKQPFGLRWPEALGGGFRDRVGDLRRRRRGLGDRCSRGRGRFPRRRCHPSVRGTVPHITGVDYDVDHVLRAPLGGRSTGRDALRRDMLQGASYDGIRLCQDGDAARGPRVGVSVARPPPSHRLPANDQSYGEPDWGDPASDRCPVHGSSMLSLRLAKLMDTRTRVY